MGKLSHKLIDLGFFSAMGTSEYVCGQISEDHVKRGVANTYDSNNGVVAIYDEEGRPWIAAGETKVRVNLQILAMPFEYNLTRGAYVPHSNDGGRFVNEVMLEL